MQTSVKETSSHNKELGYCKDLDSRDKGES